jgi:hypothetical protein
MPNTCTRPSAALASSEPWEAATFDHRRKGFMFRPKDSLDRLFAIGIIGKGLNGLAESC